MNYFEKSLSLDALKIKPFAFIAMPFDKKFNDVFYYGIQNPVHAINYLCERIDKESFTGDVLVRIKDKIKNSSLLIADLTGNNPNVYLEVGYAWGNNIPTILIVRDHKELLFDIRGQRCLKYESIRDLEESLTKELKELKNKGII